MEKEMATTPVFLAGESHGRRSLSGCRPWGREESDTTEWPTLIRQKDCAAMAWHGCHIWEHVSCDSGWPIHLQNQGCSLCDESVPTGPQQGLNDGVPGFRFGCSQADGNCAQPLGPCEERNSPTCTGVAGKRNLNLRHARDSTPHSWWGHLQTEVDFPALVVR